MLGPALLGLALAGSGCASLQTQVVGAAMDRMVPGQPTVNSYTFWRWPFGSWAALSVWRVQGPLAPDEAIEVGGLPQGLPMVTRVMAPGESADEVRGWLIHETRACGSPMELLRKALERTRALWPQGFATFAVPAVELLVVPPHRGSAGWRLTSAADPGGLTLVVVSQLFESRECIWLDHWAADTAGTIGHELAHHASYMLRGDRADLLHEEFMAYGVSECVYRAVIDEDRPRKRSFPGLEDLPLARVFELEAQGRLPPTLAARYLAQLYWEGRPDVDDRPWQEACRQWFDEDPNPRQAWARLEPAADARRRALAQARADPDAAGAGAGPAGQRPAAGR